ncbi:uncharacterized [Tachysurus ichikawai]
MLSKDVGFEIPTPNKYRVFLQCSLQRHTLTGRLRCFRSLGAAIDVRRFLCQILTVTSDVTLKSVSTALCSKFACAVAGSVLNQHFNPNVSDAVRVSLWQNLFADRWLQLALKKHRLYSPLLSIPGINISASCVWREKYAEKFHMPTDNRKAGDDETAAE